MKYSKDAINLADQMAAEDSMLDGEVIDVENPVETVETAAGGDEGQVTL